MISIKFKNDIYKPTKIICVGKNYVAHAREMGDKSLPEKPVIFLKPNSALMQSPSTVNIPLGLGILHHEVELCFMIGKECKNISESKAKDCISAYCVGIDFTLREKQKELKQKGHPWELSKGFDCSCVVGEFKELSNNNKLNISLKLNGEVRQDSNTKSMIFAPEKILSYVSGYMTMNEGDIVMCGTPEGVGPVNNGDIIEAEVTGIPVLKFKVMR